MAWPWARTAGQLLTPGRGSHGRRTALYQRMGGGTEGAFPPGHLPAPESVWLLSALPEGHLFLKYSNPRHLKAFLIVQRQLRNIKARVPGRPQTTF